MKLMRVSEDWSPMPLQAPLFSLLEKMNPGSPARPVNMKFGTVFGVPAMGVGEMRTQSASVPWLR
jgi:hypothetical protein